METPIKIYLDQKDYSRVARALLGDDRYSEDLSVYRFLRGLIGQGRIRIYFSWCHAVEALRYDEQKIDLLQPYCDAINTLTKGDCVRWQKELEAKELELFLSGEFDFEPAISTDYPYGIFKDAFPFPEGIEHDFYTEFKKALETEFQGRLSRKERKIVSKLLKNRQFLSRALSEMPETAFREMYSKFPGFEFSKEDLITLICGDLMKRRELIQTKYNGIADFRNLVLYYSKYYPELKKLGYFFDPSADKLGKLIRLQQAMYPIYKSFDLPHMDETGLYRGFVQRYLKSIEEDLISLSRKYGFSVDKARERLMDTKLSGIPSVRSPLIFGIEYYKRHKGDYDRGRKPRQSDIMDIHHIRNLPYVEFYSTDRFFGEVARTRSREFRTEVVTSLTELRTALETNLRKSL